MKKIISSLFGVSISYGITVNNETQEIKKLLDKLIPLIDNNDEIIVLQDVTNEDFEVTDILKSYGNHIIRITSCLDGDFATFKNNLIKKASKKYLFQLDADELPETSLINNVKTFLLIYFKRDVFLVPRINIVNGITEEHIKKWDWNVTDNSFINYPDYQERILKLNHKISWINKVHEKLTGFKKLKRLPAKTSKYCILHEKNIKKQEVQNKFYESL
ncbi:MAG: hypothetical protein KA232_07600 [Chryseobacterium sp.]|nr:hypothetical protein [Chryseobacterium sp.]